ncbi:unnamed protein product [Discosporangium mesarthrocarpum]
MPSTEAASLPPCKEDEVGGKVSPATTPLAYSSVESSGGDSANRKGRKRVSALIDRGVQWETWLIGIQHQFLGFPSRATTLSAGAVAGAAARCPKCLAFEKSSGNGQSSAVGAKDCPQQQVECEYCEIERRTRSRRRFLCEIVESVADFCERACLHRDFLSRFYLSRLGAALLFFTSAVYVNALATMVSTHRNPYALLMDRQGRELDMHTLPDLGHDLWALVLTTLGHDKEYINEHSLPDVLVAFLGRAGCLFSLCHPQRLKIIRRICMIFGMVLLMRAVSVSVTVLPDASPVCRERFSQLWEENLFPGAFMEAARFAWSPTSMVTCGDMIFSGHTSCLMMVALVFRKYCRAKKLQTKVIFKDFHVTEQLCSMIRLAVYGYVGIGCLVIIGSKLHYTLDVLLAILFNYGVFRCYHDWARYAKLKKKIKLLQWLEADAVLEMEDLAYRRATRP